MNKPTAAKKPEEISLKCSSLTICLLLIFIFTLFNGYLDSVYYEYGATHYWECTFLGEPVDLHGDLVKSSVSLASTPPPDLSNWSPHYKEFYLHNAYGNMADIPTGKVTVFSVTPLVLLLLAGLLKCILILGPGTISAEFYLMNLTILGALCWQFIDSLRDRILAFVVLALSYPFSIILTRGNIGATVTAFTLILYIYLTCNKRHLVLSALCLAVACNVRPNAILLAPLFLCFGLRRSLIGTVLFVTSGAAIAGVTYVVATHLFPGYSHQVFLRALENYTRLYVIEHYGNGNNNSAYGMIKILECLFLTGLNPFILLATNQIISGIGAILIGLTSYKYWRGHLPIYHFAFAITCIYILASTIFATYHLTILFIFVLAAGCPGPENRPFPNFVLFMSALVLIPKSYFFFYPSVSCEVILNPLILLFSVGWILFSNYPPPVEVQAGDQNAVEA